MEEDGELYARSSARVGTTLRGKYRIDRVLGMGGMAVVYAATHRNLKRFAVKMLHAELSIREDIRARFLREGYAANALDHPGAVSVLDDDVAEDGSAFLVMELLRGDGIDHLWEKGGQRLPLEAVLTIGERLLDVLAAAHAKGVVHRDIKPANVFLTEDGNIKVLDFGIARVRDVVASGGVTTGTGILLGTPAFMAPEQAHAKSREVDGQSDLWAVGATLFTLLSGQLVHEGENATQLLIRAATTQARSVISVLPGTPPAAAEIIDRALAFEKGARWPSARAMQDAILDTYPALFGRPVSRAPLLALFPGGDAVLPASPPSGPPRASESSAPEIPLSKFSSFRSPYAQSIDERLGSSPEHTAGARASSLARGIRRAEPSPITGMSTSKPVSIPAVDADEESQRAPHPAWASPARVGAIAIGILAVGLSTFELARSRSAATPRTPSDEPPAALPIALAATPSPAPTSPAPHPPLSIDPAPSPPLTPLPATTAARLPARRTLTVEPVSTAPRLPPSSSASISAPVLSSPEPAAAVPVKPTVAEVPPLSSAAEGPLPVAALPPAAPATPHSVSLSPSVVGSPPPFGWSKCADDNDTCILTGTHTVAYGANGRFSYRRVTSSIGCNEETFRSPFPDIGKACYYK
jgi:serine/threonine-protein kinase